MKAPIKELGGIKVYGEYIVKVEHWAMNNVTLREHDEYKVMVLGIEIENGHGDVRFQALARFGSQRGISTTTLKNFAETYEAAA